jgi:hypothetical protein
LSNASSLSSFIFWVSAPFWVISTFAYPQYQDSMFFALGTRLGLGKRTITKTI